MIPPRHERAMTITTAYLIGFTAAFLLYAQPQIAVDLFPTQSAATVITATDVVSPDEASTVVAPKTLSIKITDAGYTVSAADQLVYSSTEINYLPSGTENNATNYYVGTPFYKFSADESQIFVCEYQATDATSCLGKIITSEGRVEPITKEGAPVLITTKSAETAIFTAFGFKVATFESVDSSTPWALQ